jgi:SAM-dependent methyltransferase
VTVAEDPAHSGLHPLVGGFTDAAGYEAARPRYDERVAAVLAEQLELESGAPVLELGAGTGQLSRALVASGLDLLAVEPLGATRELLAAAIGPERVRDGRAEQIPLADASVEAVFAADAFHWFDEQRAMPEIKRVLRPRGGVAILRTVPVLDSDWGRALGRVITASRPEHPVFAGRGAAAALEEDPAFGPVIEKSMTSSDELDREGLIAYVASFSWVASLTPQQREQMLDRVREVLVEHGVGRSRHELLHRIWLARLV